MSLSVIAYHGTTMDVVEKIEREGFIRSERDGTWLGHGAYFFESGPQQAASWAANAAEERGGEAVVIEAKVELANYIDLADRDYWDFFRSIYDDMQVGRTLRRQIGPISMWLPNLRRNSHFGHNLRDFDIVNQAVAVLENSQFDDAESVQSDEGMIEAVRCPFSSGRQVFPQSWFFSRSCIMLSVRKMDCIKDWSIYS